MTISITNISDIFLRDMQHIYLGLSQIWKVLQKLALKLKLHEPITHQNFQNQNSTLNWHMLMTWRKEDTIQLKQKQLYRIASNI